MAITRRGRFHSPPPKEREPVYTWSFESSKAVGGQKIHYAVELFEDGTLKCNCPAFIYKRKTVDDCKHTTQVRHEVPTLLQMWKDGANLPVLTESAPKTGFVAPSPTKKPEVKEEEKGRIKYGRVIEV